jgi:hypothetical protein
MVSAKRASEVICEKRLHGSFPRSFVLPTRMRPAYRDALDWAVQKKREQTALQPPDVCFRIIDSGSLSTILVAAVVS